MAKKADTKEKFEREYNIPLREQVKFAPRYKKTKKAVRTIKEFLAQHMKIRDRDLRKIRLDKYLNEAVWSRGIRHPPHHIKVKATFEPDTGLVRAELVDYPVNLKFKKLREEKLKTTAKAVVESKKGLMEKAKETLTKKPEQEEKKEEAKEKEQASAEAEQAIEKELAKQEKHTENIKPKIEEKSRQKKVYNKSSRGH